MNLTTLANVRSWVSSSTDTDNNLLIRLIAEASRMALNYMQRADLGLTTITETISGKNTPKQPLRCWPVIAVNSLSLNGVVIPASTGPLVYGYALEQVYGSSAGKPQMLGIVGSVYGSGGGYPSPYGYYGQSPPIGGVSLGRPFSVGVNNILVNYTYGYAVQNEAQKIPPTSAYTIAPNAPYGSLSQDLGVSYATGGALTAISSGTPTVGQYLPPNLSGDTPTLVYTFAAADAGKGVLLNYNYVPYDIEQAVIEIVAERYRYKERIGQSSQSLGGQTTTSYMVKDALTAAIKARFDPYRLVWAGG